MNYTKVREKMTLFLEIAAVGLIAAIFILLCVPTKGDLLRAKENETSEEARMAATEEVLAGMEIKAAGVENLFHDKAGETEKSRKRIALTFDDGPTPTVTNRILDTLEKYQAKATFFVVGRQLSHDKDLVMRAVSLGCEIGNHTWEHKQMTKYKKGALKKSISKTDEAVKMYTGYEVSLVRPTYGKVNDRVKKSVARPMIYWNVDTEDWKSRDAKKILASVKKENLRDGDIILLHDLYPATADAIEKIIPYLQKKGYELMTVSELMAGKQVSLEAGKAYYSGREVGE